jgi:hypothetical protein
MQAAQYSFDSQQLCAYQVALVEVRAAYMVNFAIVAPSIMGKSIF